MLPFVGSAVARRLAGGRPRDRPWYKQLKRPWFTPPQWVFGPVWATLYSCLGYASYVVFRDGGGFQGARFALALYGAQLVVNWAYNPLFVGYGKLKLALVDSVVLDVLVAATMYSFYQVSPLAGALLIPYGIWLTLATGITYRLYVDNGDEDITKNE